MIARLLITIFCASLLIQIASGQMRYSRGGKPAQSPTPTPSPAAVTIPARQPGAKLLPAQSPTPLPRTAPGQRPYSSLQQLPPKGSPTPLPRTTPIQRQYSTSPQTQTKPLPTASPRMTQQYPARPTPTPVTRTVQPQMQIKATPTPFARTIQTVPQTRGTPVPAQPQARQLPTPAPVPVKPTPPPLPPPDVKAYLDRQVAKSKDQKFHMTVNGGDLPLTPFHVWPQKSTGPNITSTTVSMRSDEGRVYDIDFMTTGDKVTGIRISRINGEAVR